MCGIVGYVGNKKATDILIKGLGRLEYRGYDSAGIALIENGAITYKKAKGRLKNLEDHLGAGMTGHIGIGHTRWATHGKPSDVNSHPHLSNNKKFGVVHNGIIENYRELRDELVKEGFNFQSETDTEVIPNLLEKYDDGDFLSTVEKVISLLEGAYALCILNKDMPDEIITVRKDSPLVIGKGEGEAYIASDIPAILEYTRTIYVLEDGEVGVIRREGMDFYDASGSTIDKAPITINWDLESAKKQGYEHFMLKEIHEQPDAVRKTLAGRIKEGKVDLGIDLDPEFVRGINKIAVVACGTANYAGRVGAHLIESKLRLPVMAAFASEFRYNDPIVDENTLTVVISQSGETADTLAGLRESRRKGSKILAITNVVESSIARESDFVIYTQAGPEIAVASTKAYVTQLIALYLLTLKLGELRGAFSGEEVQEWTGQLELIPEKIGEILDNQEEAIKGLAQEIKEVQSIFFIGRGMDSVSCLEGALKLKEISYIHAEAYPAGELKHGTLALITEEVPVIAVATSSKLLAKTVSNIIEVKARGAKTYGLAFEGVEEIAGIVDHLITIPRIREEFSPILAVVPLQLLSYYTSVAKGNDVDKPRNLAKSVTVE